MDLYNEEIIQGEMMSSEIDTTEIDLFIEKLHDLGVDVIISKFSKLDQFRHFPFVWDNLGRLLF